MVADPEKLMAKARRQQQAEAVASAGGRATAPLLGESQTADNLLGLMGEVLGSQQEPAGGDAEMEDGVAPTEMPAEDLEGDEGGGSGGAAVEGMEGVEEAADVHRPPSKLPAAAERQRLPAAAAALPDPVAEAAARQLLDELVRRTDGWLLQALEGLAAQAARAVHRRRRQVDRVAAVALLAQDLEGSL